ncbi:hypothetical protein BV22DRAFT_1048391 [Leucogyrophana mollusca]|uniref:Uncharacterized protein n=1 Tax=Leucogyrophana mollusca TaxID=85980 RepID=A0ACB8BBS5_9AGAM|nr:hypothetical protein BV22DRAFT_1048391 [Leucogyrophana mollusca]
MTTYGMPYFLEDKTGKLTESDFVDINDRLCLRLRCTAREPTHTAYMIYNVTCASDLLKPLVALDFGPDDTLGTIAFGSGSQMAMKQYLTKLSPLGRLPSSKTRKFIGSDGQEYRWSWRSTKGQEWTCTNSSQYLVAFYTLKLSSEPEYNGSSGCMLTIDEAYPHLVAEMLASLTIMRHIAAHNL